MNERADIADAARHLTARIQAGAPLAELRPLLEPTWAEPEHACASLLAALNARGPSLGSRIGFTTNLYQDLVIRHLGRDATALVFRDPVEGWRELTYEQLHERSSRLAATWRTAGVEAGQTVATVMPVGGHLAVALLTALRLGLNVVHLPPLGRTFVANRLTPAAPDWLVLATGYSSWLHVEPERLLPSAPDPGAVPQLGLPSYGYAPEDTPLAVFSPLGPAALEAVARPAQSILTRLATDAELVLGLRPADRVAAPDWDDQQHQPTLLLMTLFAGACWIEASTRALEDESLVARLRLTVVGVSPSLRDRILGGAVSTKGWRRWFKNPAAPYEWANWERFGKAMTDKGAWGQNLLVSAAFGGSLLFGPPQTEPQLEVLPSPGMQWALAESILGNTVSSSDSGVLFSEEEGADASAIGRFMLGDTGPSMVLAGSADEGRAGTTFPTDEVVAVAETHAAVDSASVVVNRAVRTMNSARIVLLVFVDPAKDPRGSEGQLADELIELLRTEMGEAFEPDQVRVFPLCPRRTEDGATDHDWCRWQFLTGALSDKADDELFRMTSLARYKVLQALEGEA